MFSNFRDLWKLKTNLNDLDIQYSQSVRRIQSVQKSKCDARCLCGARTPQNKFLGLNVDLGLVSSRQYAASDDNCGKWRQVGLVKVSVLRVSPGVWESLCHCVTVSLCHCFTESLCHCVTVSLSHCVTVTLRHCVTESLCHCVTVRALIS